MNSPGVRLLLFLARGFTRCQRCCPFPQSQSDGQHRSRNGGELCRSALPGWEGLDEPNPLSRFVTFRTTPTSQQPGTSRHQRTLPCQARFEHGSFCMWFGQGSFRPLLAP
jgi:hypothetical protein